MITKKNKKLFSIEKKRCFTSSSFLYAKPYIKHFYELDCSILVNVNPIGKLDKLKDFYSFKYEGVVSIIFNDINKIFGILDATRAISTYISQFLNKDTIYILTAYHKISKRNIYIIKDVDRCFLTLQDFTNNLPRIYQFICLKSKIHLNAIYHPLKDVGKFVIIIKPVKTPFKDCINDEVTTNSSNNSKPIQYATDSDQKRRPINFLPTQSSRPGLFRTHNFMSKRLVISSRSFATVVNKQSIYTDLKHFLENNPINDDTQTQIEEYLFKQGVSMSTDSKIGGIYKGLYTKKTVLFLSEIKPDLRKKIRKMIKSKNLYLEDATKKSEYIVLLIEILEEVGVDPTIEILLGRFIRLLSDTKLNPLSENNSVTSVAIDLSNNLTRECFRLKINKARLELKAKGEIKNLTEYTFSQWLKDNEDHYNKYKDSITALSIGVIMLEWLEDRDLITKKLIKLTDSQQAIYEPNEKMSEKWLNTMWTATDKSLSIIQRLNSEVNIPPRRLPCIVEPKPYSIENGKVKLGGYLLNDVDYAEPIILPNPSLNNPSIILDDNIIYKTINRLNSVGYKINTECLNFIKTQPDLFTESLIEKPKIGKRLTKRTRLEYQKILNRYEQQNHIIAIAELYSNKNLKEFFFINRIDNRGRLYCINEYLNYQSCELAKALLLFSLPNKVNRFDSIGIMYFKAYGVNCYGNKLDKKSLTNKIRWIDENMDNIINYDNGILISEAENKFLFTAFCIEYKKWHDFYYNSNEGYFDTHLPIQLDATCNGFQHLVLLSGEADLRKVLNLNPMSIEDVPNDFYTYILTLFLADLKKLVLSVEGEVRDSYIRILKFSLDRSLIKKIIMTIPYNATPKKMVEDLTVLLIKVDYDQQSWYAKSIEDKNKLSYKDLYVLVNAIKKTIDNVAPRISKLKKYLESIAKICTTLEIHIPWVLPMGLEVRQSYLLEKSVNLKPFDYSNSKIRLTTFIKKLDLSKQSRAFMPNLIHSLDANSLINLLHQYFYHSDFDVKTIYTVHDCFAMPMSHVEWIIKTISKIYTDLYSNTPYLYQLDEGIKNSIKLQYRDVSFVDNILKVGDKKFSYPDIKEVSGEHLPIQPNPYLLT